MSIIIEQDLILSNEGSDRMSVQEIDNPYPPPLTLIKVPPPELTKVIKSAPIAPLTLVSKAPVSSPPPLVPIAKYPPLLIREEKYSGFILEYEEEGGEQKVSIVKTLGHAETMKAYRDIDWGLSILQEYILGELFKGIKQYADICIETRYIMRKSSLKLLFGVEQGKSLKEKQRALYNGISPMARIQMTGRVLQNTNAIGTEGIIDRVTEKNELLLDKTYFLICTMQNSPVKVNISSSALGEAVRGLSLVDYVSYSNKLAQLIGEEQITQIARCERALLNNT